MSEADVNPEEDELPRYARDPEHGLVAGVAAGLAAGAGLDVAVVRIAFVAAALLNGAGVLAYAAAVAGLPSRDAALAGEVPRWPLARRVVAIVLAGLAVLVLVQPFHLGTSLAPLLLIGVGVALWRSTVRWLPHPPGPAGAPSGPTSEPPPGSPARRWTMPSPPRPAGPRSRLGLLTVGVALLAEAAALTLGRLGLVHLSPARMVSLALAVVGAGLVAGTVVGRARWLALPALVLAVAALPLGTAEAMGLDPLSSVVSRGYVPERPEQVAPSYRTGTGSLWIDLTGAGLAGTDRTLTATAAIGDIDVVVPPDMTLAIDAETGLGDLDLPQRAGDLGTGRRAALMVPGAPGRGSLRLRLRAGVGSIHVLQLARPGAPQPTPQPEPTA
jgi:phage shock protein PspC (stress-responsive transcriptional regulator)